MYEHALAFTTLEAIRAPKTNYTPTNNYDFTFLTKGMLQAFKCEENFFFRKFTPGEDYFYKMHYVEGEQEEEKMFTWTAAGLSPKGVKEIIDHLKTKHSKPYLKAMPYEVCTTEEEFRDKIEAMVTAGLKQCIFLCRLYDGSHHMTPYYVEKTEDGNFKAVITDSCGLINYEVGWLRNAIPEDAHLTVYANNYKRQKDRSNCVIFCIRDFVQFAKNSKAILEWVENKELSEYTSDTIPRVGKVTSYRFSKLPPQMMSVTQSISQIDAYKKWLAEMKVSDTVRLKSKHIINNSNQKLRLFYLKYHMFLVRNRIMK